MYTICFDIFIILRNIIAIIQTVYTNVNITLLKLKQLISSQNVVQFDENRMKKMPIYRLRVKNGCSVNKFLESY